MIEKIRRFFKKKLHPHLYNLLKNIYNWSKPIIRPIQNFFFKIKLKKIHANHEKALKIIRKKEKIKVVFLVIHESVWKYDELYRLMEQDKRFDPIIVICPYVVYGEDNMLREMNQAFNAFNKKGYKTIKALKENDTWLDVKNEIKPDIVFFTNPWKLTKNQYYINNFNDILTCYVPYFYQVTKHLKENFGGLLQNTVWKVFYESNIHFEYAKRYSKNNAANVIITGYPGIDDYIFQKKINNDPWKIKDEKIKRIIWAPHHTINGQDAGLGLSNFITYSDFFINLLDIYHNYIQIAFKPHPLLKPKLYKDSNWGIKKTDKYYSMWNNHENGLLIEGDYTELFLTSDAMIHDCGSFTVEYLSTSKPTLYLLNNANQLNSLNSFGKMAINYHYKAYDTLDIEKFVKDIVIKGDDYMKNKRIEFIHQFLMPPNNKTATKNIFDYILSALKNLQK